jgi:hypothetical protein
MNEFGIKYDGALNQQSRVLLNVGDLLSNFADGFLQPKETD